MTAHLNRSLLMLAIWAACSCSVRPLAVAADDLDPASMPPVLSESGDELSSAPILEDRIVLDPDSEFISGATESIMAGEMIEGESMPIVESVVESMGEPPQILDVSSQGFDGMLMDDFNVDEMPFEASSGRWFWNGGWYIGGESLWMDRSREDRVSIAQEVIPTIAGSRLVSYTTTPQPFNVSPGARVTIGKSLGRDYLDRDRAIEFIYYGGLSYNDNDGRNSRSADGFLTPLDIFAPGFNGASTYN
ncbi:MAG: hypothetical protein ACR2IT_02660, partial [Pirellulales bacterium]